MDHLLQDILCRADDTPVYTSKSTKKDIGNNQMHMCRSWSQLDAWAKQNSACYGFINETQGVDTTLSRYKWCPKNSPFEAPMRRRLGLPPDWAEQRPEEIESIPPYWQEFSDNEFVFNEDTAI